MDLSARNKVSKKNFNYFIVNIITVVICNYVFILSLLYPACTSVYDQF